MKTCSKCGVSKPKSSYPKDASRPAGIHPRCKDCYSADRRAWYQQGKHMQQYMVKWRADNPARQKEYNRRSRLLYRFGLTVETYEEMLEEQGGVCAICGGTNKHGARLAVDHCHRTGRVRGLLCVNCNLTLGKVEANLQGYIKYLDL